MKLGRAEEPGTGGKLRSASLKRVRGGWRDEVKTAEQKGGRNKGVQLCPVCRESKIMGSEKFKTNIQIAWLEVHVLNDYVAKVAHFA